MSAIYFHTLDDDAAVRGPERHHFAFLTGGMASSVFGAFTDEWDKPSILRQLFPADHYLLQVRDFKKAFETHLHAAYEGKFLLDGESLDAFSVILNTAWRMGSNPIRLAARLHGQCEIHTYVEGPNRKWLAEIIREGRATQIFRENMGWEQVIVLLEKDAREPVVTSFSVTEQFPNPWIANFTPPRDEDGDLNWDAWYALTDETKWEMAITGLRQQSNGLEMNPATWNTFHFSHGVDANMLVQALLHAKK